MLDAKGVSQFHLIQPRIANTDPNTIAHLVRSTPVVYFVFDLLYLDGYDLRKVALGEAPRTARSRSSRPARCVRVSEAFPGAGEEMLEAARENGLEGIIAKHATSCYESRRSREWLKIKIVNRAGVRHRRLHRAAGRSRLFRRAGARACTRRQAALGRATSAPASTRRRSPRLNAGSSR